MGYNKRQVRKVNDKKVLHKVRKRWVVVSAALLMALGGTAVAGHVNAKAAANNNGQNNTTASSSNVLKNRINSSLQTQSSANNNNQQANNNQQKQVSAKGLQNQAEALHQRIVQSAAQSQPMTKAVAPKLSNPNPNVLGSTHNNQVAVMPNSRQLGQEEPAPSPRVGINLNADGSHYDEDNLFGKNPINGHQYQYDNTSKAVYYSDNDVDPFTGNSDVGSIYLKYYDPTNRRQVGRMQILEHDESDGASFPNSNIGSYERNLPQADSHAPYGYQLLNPDNFADPQNIDSGSNINNVVGGENQLLVINVQPKPNPNVGGNIEVEYEDVDDHNAQRSSHVFTAPDGLNFNQNQWTMLPPSGYKVVGYNTQSDNNTSANVNTHPITKFEAGTQILHIFVAPASNKVSAQVHYIDEASDNEVGTPRTIYGSDTSTGNKNKINFSDLTNFIPSGYQYDSTYSDSSNGISKGISGDTIFKPHNASVVNIYVKKGNPTPNAQNVKYGTVHIHYQIHGHTSDVFESDAVGPTSGSHDSFNIASYDNVAPDGYSIDHSNAADSNGVTQFKTSPQDVYVYVTKNSTPAAQQVSNDYIQYESVDPNNPSALPQPINKNGFNFKEPLYGAPGTIINYDQYTSNPPQGYVYYHLGDHSARMRSNQDNIILVEPIMHQNNVSDGTIYVHYQVAGQNDVATEAFNGPTSGANDGFNIHNIAGSNGSGIDATNMLPTGYSLDTTQGTDGVNLNNVTQYKNTAQDVYVYVKKSGVVPSNVSNDYVQYMIVDPNNPSAKPTYINNNPNSDKKSLTDKPGTPIDYSFYAENVPSGYSFVGYGNPHDLDEESNEDNIILVEKNQQVSAPIHVHYIDQNGSDIDRLSTLDPNHDNIPSDEEPINGSFGQTFSTTDITTMRHVPSGFSLDNGQDSGEYSISSSAQDIDLMVHGNSQNTNHKNNNYKLIVKSNIVDPSGNPVTSYQTSDPIAGNTGDIVTINPSNYMPNPQSDYQLDNDNNYNVQITSNGIIQGKNGSTNTIGQPIPNNTITYTYKEINATGHILYKDVSDGSTVGHIDINGLPNTPMSGFYNSLNSDVPYGFKYQSDNGSNNAKLENDTNYIIDVKNAHLQRRPMPTPRKNYGYIQINYQMSDGSGTNRIVSSTVASSDVGHPFNHGTYMTSTDSGGEMPDSYANPTAMSGDSGITAFEPGVQTYNILVQPNTSNSNANKFVNDQINYEILNSDGQAVNENGTPNTNNNPYKTVQITGKDGNSIDFSPYTNDVPYGYYYDTIGEYGSVYTGGLDSNARPIATIYIMKSKNASHNMIPGYNPSDTPSDAPSGGHGKAVGGSTANAKGDYFPWTGINHNGPAPLDGPENPHYPISGYDASNPTVPDNWKNDNNGYVPQGYVPAWVPNAKGSNTYASGFVPSDNIPDNYVPGFIPNGHGSYVPGYIPENQNDWPSGKNGSKTIPKYVPGKVDNGNGGKTPGIVPDIPPYATDTTATVNIEYVDVNNGNNRVESVAYNGKVGSDLNLNDGSNIYLNNLPVGYSLDSVLGKEKGNKDYTTSPTTNASAPNYVSDISSKNNYTLSDNPYTIQIGVKRDVSGTIVYDDANTGAQVGTASIEGPSDSTIDFTGADKRYTQLLPFNYSFNSVPGGMSNQKLIDGGTYVIDVNNNGDMPAPSPRLPRKYGVITVNYVNASNSHQTLGTESLTGKYGDHINNSDLFTKTTAQGGYIPYGYNNPIDPGNQLSLDTFGRNPQTIDITVSRDNTINPDVSKPVSDKVEYVAMMGSRQKPIYIDHTTGKPTLNSAGNQLMTFTIKGNAGSSINYSPYTADIPSGYYYDGMGNHSSVFDGAHNGANGSYDEILVRPGIKANNYQNGSIVITYKDTNPADSTHGQNIDQIALSGQPGTLFDSGYYESNLPSGYTIDSGSNASDIFSFGQTPQDATINVKQQAPSNTQYGQIRVHFVEAGTGNSSNPSTMTQVPGSIVNDVYGMTGEPFNPGSYEDNTPKNTNFAAIEGNGNDIYQYNSTPQDLYIAVDPTNGSWSGYSAE